LTGHEYALLSASKLGFDQALRDKGPNWPAAAQNACLSDTFGTSTPLLTSQKTDCLGLAKLDVALASFPAAYARCAKLGRKRRIVCLVPRYETLADDAVDAYRGDVQARRAILKRGFTGACAAALGSTPKRLGDDRKLVASSKRLSADVQLLVEIEQGRRPPGSPGSRRLGEDSRALNRDIRLVTRETPLDDLSSCPHQAG
jgi:hypothetical protein